MFKEFLKARQRHLKVAAIGWVLLVVLKFGFSELYEASSYKGFADLMIVFGLPVGFLWEWFDFRKKRNNK